MAISFLATLQKRGALLLPEAFVRGLEGDAVELRLRLGDLEVAFHGYIQRWKTRGSITVPRFLCRQIDLPVQLDVVVKASTEAVRRRQMVIPLNGKIRFEGTARRAGSNGGLQVTVPMPWVRGAQAAQWPGGLQVALRYAGSGYDYATVLRISHRRKNPVAFLSIPQKGCPDVGEGDRVCVELRPARLVEAGNFLLGDDRFDWGALRTDNAFLTEHGERLTINGARSFFDFSRYTSTDPVCWLLGFYQAEGSKEGSEFSVPNKNPYLLREVIKVLENEFGVSRSRMGLRVSYAPKQDPQAVKHRFKEIVGVGVITVRQRSGLFGEESAVVRIQESGAFVGMINAALSQLIDHGGIEQLSPDAARRFAIGFLDGDGTIRRSRGSAVASLVMSGDERELVGVQRAINRGFAWPPKKFSGEGDMSRSLSMDEVADLLQWGVFGFSMTWPRMLYSLVTKTKTVRRIHEQFGDQFFCVPPDLRGPVNFLSRWGLVDQLPDRRVRLAPRAMKAIRVFHEHADDLSRLRERFGPQDEMIRGRKGLTNPLIDRPESLQAPVLTRCHQRVVREQAAETDPREHLASLEGCEVVSISKESAAEIILKYEWLGTMGRATACYGLLSSAGELLGVACFGRGPGLYGGDVCGEEHRHRAVCLERGACVHWAPKNSASFLIRHATRLAAREHGWSIYYAYADPTAGEIGTVYQAANWYYIGQGPGRASKKRKSRFIRPDGSVVSSRTLHYHGLTRAGAAERGWRAIEAPTKHKYVWFEGVPSERRRLRKLCKYSFLSYPKRGAEVPKEGLS